jgi:YHS domain-containing protein
MTDVKTLITRIDQELEAKVKENIAVWQDVKRTNREREARLQRYEKVAEHLVELVKPRLAAFVERFKSVATVEPSVREHTRAVNLTFASHLAKVTMSFEAFPDVEARHVRLECTVAIYPVLVRYDKQSVLEFPLDEVQDDAVVRWFDDRIVDFVKAYLALMRQDADLQDHFSDQLVEDPVAKIRFPKYLASSTLERDGQLYYFVDEETRRDFENERDAPAAKEQPLPEQEQPAAV